MTTTKQKTDSRFRVVVRGGLADEVSTGSLPLYYNGVSHSYQIGTIGQLEYSTALVGLIEFAETDIGRMACEMFLESFEAIGRPPEITRSVHGAAIHF
jgi:hypothetical protein